MSQHSRTYSIEGITCAACVNAVEKAINKVDGVAHTQVNLVDSSAVVTLNQDVDTLESIDATIVDAVLAAGYGVKQDSNVVEHQSQFLWQTHAGYALLLAVPIVVLSMFVPDFPWRLELVGVLSFPVVFILGREFFVNAWNQLKHKSANMDTLVALGTGTAYLASLAILLFGSHTLVAGHNYFESAAVIVALVLFGRHLEHNAKRRTSGAIEALMGSLPDNVTVENEQGIVETTSLSNVAVGDIVVVKTGNTVPVDGIVQRSEAWLDESLVTGESVPVLRKVGDTVIAGSACANGQLHIETTGIGEQTRIAEIARFIHNAQSTKAPVQRLADAVAAVFVPIVLGIAILTSFVWWQFGGDNGGQIALLTGIAVLVIACPCALGLATPTALIAGLGRAAQMGVLIRDAEALEQMQKVGTVLFDKTGTLTVGEPAVVHVHEHEPLSASELSIVAIAERQVEHPIATAIVQHIDSKLTDGSVQEQNVHVNIVPGRGLVATYQDKEYLVGSLVMMREHGIDQGTFEESIERSPHTLVCVAVNKTLRTVFEVGDALKPEAKEVVAELQRRNVDVGIVSGDRKAVVQHVAATLGINKFEAEVSPEDKARYVQQLRARGAVAMVGDGINDAPALVSADVGIAMGRGADVAIESAGIIVPSSDISKVLSAFAVSTNTGRIIRSNLVWAFAYNVAGIPLAAGVLYPLMGWLLNPMYAGAAMAFSSVSVVLNSLRLKRMNMN